MAYADQEMSGNRIVAIIIVAIIHVAIGYTLVTGLAYEAASKVIERVTTIDVDEPPPPEPEDEPPPPPEDIPDAAPPPPVAPPAPINIAPPPPIRTQTTIPPPAPVILAVPPPAPPAPPAPSLARGASPKGQSRWTRRIIENYPSRAIREELEGTVGLTVSIGANGRVSGCRVTSSSGHSILDDAACKDYTRYARFEPALNAAGDAIVGSYSQAIRYQLN